MKSLLLSMLLWSFEHDWAHVWPKGIEPPDPNIPRPLFVDSFEGEDPRPFGPAPGIRVYQYDWEHVWYGAKWPDGISTLAPIGSFTMRTGFSTQRYGLPAAGKVVTTSFVPDFAAHRISWAGAQGIAQVGYLAPQRAIATTVTISEHRADMYAPCQVT